MAGRVVLRNEILTDALHEFYENRSNDTFIGVIIALAEMMQMNAVLPVAVDGDMFRSIEDEEDGEFVCVFSNLEEAEMGPETDMAMMTVEEIAGNILMTDGLQGFILNAFSDAVFIDRDALNAIVETAKSTPLKEVTIDCENMPADELLDLAFDIEQGENNFVSDPVTAASIYNNIIDDDFEFIPEDPDPDDIRIYREAKAQAMNNLAVLYMTGNGVEFDPDKARELFDQAASDHNPSALFNLGAIAEEEGDHDKAAELYKEAAVLGDTKALTKLGSFYLKGNGVEKDIKKAQAYLLKAADELEESAFYYLGLIEEKGYLGIPDKEKALYYYTFGADLEDIKCMDKLSDIYEDMPDLDIDKEGEPGEDDEYYFDLSEKPSSLRN